MYAKSDGRSSRKWKALCTRLKIEWEPICWLCGEWIDRSLPTNDKYAWTLDHKMSLDEHPEIDPLDINNLAPAHRSCNGKKGARSYNHMEKPKGSRVW